MQNKKYSKYYLACKRNFKNEIKKYIRSLYNPEVRKESSEFNETENVPICIRKINCQISIECALNEAKNMLDYLIKHSTLTLNTKEVLSLA